MYFRLAVVALILSVVEVRGGSLSEKLIGTWNGSRAAEGGVVDLTITFSRSGVLIWRLAAVGQTCLIKFSWKLDNANHLQLKFQNIQAGNCSGGGDVNEGLVEFLDQNNIMIGSTSYRRM